MKATVRAKDGVEYVDGDISLAHGFVRIKNAKQRELTYSKRELVTWKEVFKYVAGDIYELTWKTVKKNASITLPEGQVLWIEETDS